MLISRANITHSNKLRESHTAQNYATTLLIDHNHTAKVKYGNKQRNGIKLAQWNAGHGNLSSPIQMNEVRHIINDYHPSVLGITESSFHANSNIEDIEIETYDVVLSNTMFNQSLSCSRVAVYISHDITYKIRSDLMCDTFSSIWLELGKPRQKKILLCCAYREWKYLNQEDESSSSVEAQMHRWISFLCQWEVAMGSGREVCVMGDMNLNFLTWMNSNVRQTSHAKKLQPLVTELFEKIIPFGFTQLVNEATRFMSGVEPSGLDHLYTNQANHMSDT